MYEIQEQTTVVYNEDTQAYEDDSNGDVTKVLVSFNEGEAETWYIAGTDDETIDFELTLIAENIQA